MEETTIYLHRFITGLTVAREPTVTTEPYPCNYEELSDKIKGLSDRNVSKSFKTFIKTLRNDFALIKLDSIKGFHKYLIQNSFIHDINKIGLNKFFEEVRFEFIRMLKIINRYVDRAHDSNLTEHLRENHITCPVMASEMALAMEKNDLMNLSVRKVYATYILFWLFFNINHYTNKMFSDIVAKILFFLFMDTGKNIIFKPSMYVK